MSDENAAMDVARWLEGLGLGRYAEAFESNDVDARVLPALTGDDLKEIGVDSVGHRRRLLGAIAALADGAAAAPAAAPERRHADADTAERRQLCVLFCDLVGSTRLSSELDPEDMRSLMRQYQDAVSSAVTGHGGLVANYLGDGVVVYFGWPRAFEDQAARAARAGLAAVRSVAALKTPAGAHLAARAGIATGRVVVGDLAGEASHQADAISGETPNLAARLQAVAAPGEVVIDVATRELLPGTFELEDKGSHDLKGLPQPVQAWRLGAEAVGERRSSISRDDRYSPFVGRDSEMALLRARWEQARAGEGRVVLLSGEAGVGKSRLVRVLRARVQDEPHARLSLQCAPQYRHSMLHPVIGHLQRAAGFAREDTGDQKLAKLEAILSETARPQQQTAALLGALLALPIEGRYPPLDMSPQRQLEDTLSALVEQTVALAGQAAALVIAEDLHWADPVSLDLIGRLIPMAADHPILMLLVFRQEFVPPWPGHGHVTVLTLDRLGRSDGERIIRRVADDVPLPGELVDRILKQTDGVPLFVEELTRSVLESGVVRRTGDGYVLSGPIQDLAVPATLQDSLTARLDRLGPAREVAQTAACIGRRFAHALLAEILPDDGGSLANAVQRLVDSQLVFRRGASPHATYEFKHALVRDAAYQGLLRSRRIEIHRRIAEVIESLHPAVAEGEPELLAHHYTLGDAHGQAASYRLAAARRLLSSSALAEAVRQSQLGLNLLAGVDDDAECRRLEVGFQITLATAHAGLRSYAAPDVARACVRAEQLCDPVTDADSLFRILAIQASHEFLVPDYPLALETSRRLLQLGERTGMNEARFVANVMRAVSNWSMGDNEQAAADYRAALGILPEIDASDLVRDTGFDWPAFLFGFKAFMHAQQGEYAQALECSDKSMELAGAAKHQTILAGFMMLRCAFLRWIGDLEGSAAVGADAIALADEQFLGHFGAEARVFRGQALLSMGLVKEGAALIAEGNAGMQESCSKTALGVRLCYEAVAAARAGEIDAARALIAQAVDAVERLNEQWYGPLVDYFEAGIDVLVGRQDVAEAGYRKAIDRTDRNGWFGQRLMLAIGFARFLIATDRPDEARAMLKQSIDRIANGHDSPIVQSAQALMEQCR